MPHHKGRFVSEKAKARALLSSARLKSWREGLKQHSAELVESKQHHEVSPDKYLDSDTPNIAETVTENGKHKSALPSGLRIVELSHISEQLKNCIHCRSELNIIINNTVREDSYGFGSALTLMCRHCGNINKIDINKKHRHDDCERGPKSFVIDIKATVGLYLSYILF